MDEKRKIVFLSRFQDQVQRGVESAVNELSKRLDKYFEVAILSGKDSDSLMKIFKGNYDVVIPTNGRIQALKVSVVRFFKRYKLLIVGHSGVGRDDLWNLMVCRPDIFVVLTDYQKNWAEKFSLGTAVIKIPNGVDLEKFNKVGSKVNVNLQRPVILSVGSLDWYKHHERTIKAVSLMLKGSLLIIGSGPEQRRLINLGNKLLGDKRFKLISSTYEKISDYYRSADVFTLPSWDRESFGIVYLEALASNLPVVAPDDSTRREIIGNAGVLTNVKDPQRFALALEYALNKNWGELPRKQAEKFSWDKVCKGYVEVIRNLV